MSEDKENVKPPETSAVFGRRNDWIYKREDSCDYVYTKENYYKQFMPT